MEPVWAILIGVFALAVGGVVGFLLAERRAGANLAAAGRERGELETKLASIQAEANARIEGLREQSQQLNATLCDTSKERDAARDEVSRLKIQGQKLTSELDGERASVASQKKLLAEAEAKFKDVFATVGTEALSKNSQSFLDLAKQRFETLSKEADGSLAKRQEQIKTLLEPMMVMLDQYQKRLAEVEKVRQEDKQQLGNLLSNLRESHQQLNTQTHQLVSALRRPTTRGRWGEITLRRLVEMAGMSAYCDFDEQANMNTEEGRLRPDMVVTLPNDRRVIIDSKVPYDSFADGLNESDEQRRAELFKSHARAVRARCMELAGKAYQSRFEDSLEFTIMFLPGEAFLYAAVEQEPSIVEDAMARGVVIATPTTLVSLLKAIEFGWRQQRVADNAAEIQRLGEELHGRIGVFVEHFCRVGKCIDGAADAYNKAMVSMERNLLLTTQRIEEHGVKSGKQIAEPDGIDTRLETLGDRATEAVSRSGGSGGRHLLNGEG